jgi:beta-phosphoglucomutase-like phosphatase (HAD superfamily)
MSKNLKALIFDVDGTIADTEQYGHLPASNDAMKELGLDIVWTWNVFKGWINTIPGNANRLIHSLKERNVPQKEIDKLCEAFIPLKKKIYIEKYLPNLKLRKGIVSLMKEALSRGVKLAVVSTSHETQIRALLESQLSEFYPHFNPIFGKETGRKTENDGFLHKKCLSKLAVSANEAIVIEDAQNGLDAAQCAEIPTAVFYNDYTYGSCFNYARLVAPSAERFNLESLTNICLD